MDKVETISTEMELLNSTLLPLKASCGGQLLFHKRRRRHPSLLQSMSYQLRTAGNAQFSKQPEQVVLYSVFAQFQLLGDVPIGFAGSHQ
jgi:hypothetical protein